MTKKRNPQIAVNPLDSNEPVYARAAHIARKYSCSTATAKRWIDLLEAHGADVKRIGPQYVAIFVPDFSRLFPLLSK